MAPKKVNYHTLERHKHKNNTHTRTHRRAAIWVLGDKSTSRKTNFSNI